jgi:hypothetical protein
MRIFNSLKEPLEVVLWDTLAVVVHDPEIVRSARRAVDEARSSARGKNA